MEKRKTATEPNQAIKLINVKFISRKKKDKETTTIPVSYHRGKGNLLTPRFPEWTIIKSPRNSASRKIAHIHPSLPGTTTTTITHARAHKYTYSHHAINRKLL